MRQFDGDDRPRRIPQQLARAGIAAQAAHGPKHGRAAARPADPARRRRGSRRSCGAGPWMPRRAARDPRARRPPGRRARRALRGPLRGNASMPATSELASPWRHFGFTTIARGDPGKLGPHAGGMGPEHDRRSRRGRSRARRAPRAAAATRGRSVASCLGLPKRRAPPAASRTTHGRAIIGGMRKEYASLRRRPLLAPGVDRGARGPGRHRTRLLARDCGLDDHRVRHAPCGKAHGKSRRPGSRARAGGRGAGARAGAAFRPRAEGPGARRDHRDRIAPHPGHGAPAREPPRHPGDRREG